MQTRRPPLGRENRIIGTPELGAQEAARSAWPQERQGSLRLPSGGRPRGRSSCLAKQEEENRPDPARAGEKKKKNESHSRRGNWEENWPAERVTASCLGGSMGTVGSPTPLLNRKVPTGVS